MMDAFWTGKPTGYGAKQPDPVIKEASLLKPLTIINQNEKRGAKEARIG